MNADKENVNCKVCNKEFKISKHNIQSDGNYCSKICKNKRFTNICLFCNSTYLSDRKTTSYCSSKCRIESNRSKLIEVKCYCCGKLFSRPSFTVTSNKRHFCSNVCNNKQYARENPNRYGTTWGSVREKKVKKSNYTCELCGTRSLEKYKIQVHHIIPISAFQEPNDAHYDDNLQTLCSECHLQIHN